MKKFSLVIATLVIFSFFVVPSYATDTQVSDLVGTTTTTTSTTTQEVTTTSTNSLQLTIPSQTENPSVSITFTDPSTDKKGVQLETDNKGFVDITSPYTFPALAIGKHTLEFKYVDENGSTQLYDTTLIVIPRAPILSAPIINSTAITVSGTGLANAEVIVLVSSGSVVINKTTTTDGDGKWNLAIDRNLFEEEVYSVNAYIRKYGYASNLSDSTKFTLNTSSDTQKNTASTFSINNISWTKVKSLFIEYQYYIFVGLTALIVGIFFGLIMHKHDNERKEEKVVKTVKQEFENITPKEGEVTLKEKLMGIKKELQDEVAEDEKIITKIDFLKDFKKFDPDNDKGEEQKPPIEVSLTSKKENS